MPSVEDNRQLWGEQWTESGDEWSVDWGGPEAQWFGVLYPRIHSFLPAGTILEIAPGHGRWTQYLKDHCERLIAVDLTQQCIDRCKERFAACSHIEYHVTDGRSLPMIADGSIDFAFCFDSLVHADADVLRAYVADLSRKLKPDGVGIIHHSNLGERVQAGTGQLPEGFVNYHWRSTNVTAALFETYCKESGLACISQEIVDWCGEPALDCFSIFTPQGSRWARPNRVLRNEKFMVEAQCVKQIAHLYSASE